MSLALDTTPTRHLSAVPEAAPAAPAPASAPASASAPRLRAVPDGTEARGFVLYVGIDELKALEAGTSLGEIVSQLKALTQQLAPSAETHAAVALAPEGAGGRDVDVVRLALHDPAALAKHRGTEIDEEPGARGGVVVDISRKRLLLDGDAAPLTYKEFELLQYLVLREGRTIDRAELISSLWSAADDEVPNERTIDVHVRRLRSKLGAFEDIVRTVRGVGYRFDRHADVSIRQASTPSPDVF
ncbi:winged helix-turn-helix domain-containing protein [Frondihabitans sp. VKM Ac-2883]|uniref:winged helix-turn-helix domain-containing protein n=1 Tax=Frondihabitans sp. VKM Ac-2883 TaxID=2783823 RepID=UPI00188CE1DD|nr:winged helix-turn-helix domain-containing protein [Frondihabitans sp. VKM Ac-2883]MBF4576055.1 winged helix-turn-helix transcriptional regulator [Frondihabitans sp. VKM Ac-2883]